MRLKLYIVHGSHPCTAVAKALELKGLEHTVVEYPPAFHAPIQKLTFGERTVPALKIDREKVVGSRRIMRRLEELVPQPSLFPTDAPARARVEEAESWGDTVLQPVARTLIWVGMKQSPAAMISYGEHSKLPLPAAALRISAPLIARLAGGLNKTGEEPARAALRALPAQLDKVDGFIADDTIGGSAPNVADLQILATVRLLLTMADVRPLIEGRPCHSAALALFPDADGEMPAGSLPTV